MARHALVALALVLSVIPHCVALAQAPADEVALGAELPWLLDWMERNNPELRAMAIEAEAAKERIYPAGALPDPMFAPELRDISRRDPTLDPSEVGSTRYIFSQNFPLWGKRDLRRGIAQAEAEQAEARRSNTRNELRTRVKTGFSQYYYAHRAYTVTGELKDLVASLERVARARYEAGLAPQQDVIKAQTEFTDIQSSLIMLEGERWQAAARLNATLGRPAHAPLGEPKTQRSIPNRARDAGALYELVAARNPQLAIQAAQIEAARRNVDLVYKNRYPDLTLSVMPVQQRNSFDAFELMFEVNIPLQQRARRHQEREALTMRNAAETRKEAIANELAGELGQVWAAFDAAARQEILIRDTLLPQTELTFQSALASYQTGRVDFTTLIDSQRQIRRARLDILRVQLEQHMRLAELEKVIGEDL
jgi:cobalt-zinc-cadmium efflux system outer membrane protein